MPPEDSDRSSRLKRYRDKRQAGASPEPFGSEIERPGMFVVQKHRARRLHYDLRLEIAGVLHSWAVPAGPSLNPAVKRLAVETEDHPLEYADFEGVIPKGNYGAGAMIVWDRGRWLPQLDPVAGLEKGKQLFELRGYKLRGLWTLVKTRGDREWLLIKKPDAWARQEEEQQQPFDEASVLSGLTVEELAEGASRSEAITKSLAEHGVARGKLDVASVGLMLAKTEEGPFTKRGWIFELKYDGYRLLAGRQGGRGVLRFRSGRDATPMFPEIARAMTALPYDALLLDGEVVVLDDDGRPVFQRLQQRGQLSRPRDIERAAIEQPVTLVAFDLLGFEGFDLRQQPLELRKELLRQLLPGVGPLRYADHVVEQGEALFAEVESRGLEGLVAKRLDARYRAGRSGDWLKIRAQRQGAFAVVGWSEPKGSRSGFGALHLAVREGKGFLYAGRVGSGFSEEELGSTRAAIEPDLRQEPPCRGELPGGPEHHWVVPRLVAEVRYTEWTEGGQLRHPVFLRLREDMAPGDSRREPERAEAPPPQAPTAVAAPEVQLTRLDKLFWPEEGITKGDLIEYYRAVSPWLLPFLADRPVVVVRYPDGIDGKSFFQKNPPPFVPDWVRTARIWSEESKEEVSHFVVDGPEALDYLINLGTIPLHVRAARLQTIGQPDWSIIDLDPKEAPFDHVVTLARAFHRLCDRIELPSSVKTSGSTGLHVLIPLGARCTHDQSRQLAGLLARIVANQHPEIATLARMPARRGGRVYLDTLQNGSGKLLVAPFSVRPLPGGPVSTPLRWSEVKRGLDIRSHNLRSVPRRLKRLKTDPLGPLLTESPDLNAVLGRLAELLEAEGGA